MAVVLPYVPQQITVHLGAPDASAQNVTVSFVDYVKNVASSEIYPTWANDLNNSLMLDLRLLPTSTINDILRIYQKLVDSDDPKYIQELNNVFEEYISMA